MAAQGAEDFRGNDFMVGYIAGTLKVSTEEARKLWEESRKLSLPPEPPGMQRARRKHRL